MESDGRRLSHARSQIKMDNKIKNRNQIKYNRRGVVAVAVAVESENQDEGKDVADGSFDATIHY